MAERLAKIFGTEEDKVNCPFYFKIGACRHGETCTRIHNKPPASQTMVFPHLYDNPPAAVAFADGLNVPQENLVEAVNHFEDFYEEVFTELAKFGELEEMVVADNIGEHMIGNVYVKYQSEDQAQAAMQGLNGRYYAGKVIVAEFSPVTDFREAKCRQYNEGACDRGGYCNFMHPKHVTRDLKKQLFKAMYDDHPDYREDRKNRTKISGDVKPVVEKRRSRSRSAGKNDRDNNRVSDRRDRDRKRSRSRSADRKHSRRSRSREHRRRDSRERRPDSRDRHRDRRDRDRRDSKSRRGGDENGSKRPEENSSKANSGRMNSEERRAMIAKWNAEEEKDNKQ
jgi:splicing factor U2AF subunit